jgi:hypothetical protein
MRRSRHLNHRVAIVAGLALFACKDDRDAGSAGTGTYTYTGTDGTGDDGSGSDDGDGGKFDIGEGDCTDPDGDCSDRIDLLFVIDNSGSMGEEQLNLAKNFPLLIDKLETLEDSEGELVYADVNIMVTTTDFGSVVCPPDFYSEPRDPEKGSPITTGCNERLARFTFNSDPPVVKEEACTEVCPEDIVPSDPFIHFSSQGDNVPDVPEADVNGDGTPDSAVAQALSCIGPGGSDGCGYESPLEAMMAAIDPASAWNEGDRPFVREASMTAIVIITDEADCSVADDSIMTDPEFMETNPDIDQQVPSSAVCWNAGVTCEGPDPDGVYTNCESLANDDLHPVSRYTDYLVTELSVNQRRRVIMLGILGVPLVTEHNPEAPFQPTAGGVYDLVYRDWRDGEYPDGDILPDEWAAGVTAEKKQFHYGIGPGCTGEDELGGFTGQAIPPVRVKEVCQALDIDDDPETPEDETSIRCCIESICDTDFSAAIGCLTGIISEQWVPEA